jgi:tRNA 2-thiouridine synthesizing protein A
VKSVEVDARGLRCPLPVMRAAQAVESLAPGDQLVLTATDPLTVSDVRAWVGESGGRIELVSQVVRVVGDERLFVHELRIR